MRSYWTLSGSTPSMKIPKYDIDGWAATTSTLPDDDTHPSQASGKTIGNHKNTHSHGLFTPSLTIGTSPLTTPSALTNTIKITSHPRLAPVKVKVEPASDAIEVYSNGGLSDYDDEPAHLVPMSTCLFLPLYHFLSIMDTPAT